jgi:2-oxoglutarate ferredoxin oxidoreductase subunit beta
VIPVYTRPKSLSNVVTHYCPGCTHGIAHRLVAETIDELGIQGKTIGVASVGCSVFAYNYFECDFQQAAHGRAPAVATGIKRVHPDRVVFTYQGDGDLASIGMAEIVHAAVRGENITVIFINNAIYGMTGGQMAPTTLIGQKTTTSPQGRDKTLHGLPIRIAEIFSEIPRAVHVERVSVHNPRAVRNAKKAILKAFRNQIEGKGFSLVEVLSTCPVNWGMTPVQALEWVEREMMRYYPVKVFRDGEDYEKA